MIHLGPLIATRVSLVTTQKKKGAHHVNHALKIGPCSSEVDVALINLTMAMSNTNLLLIPALTDFRGLKIFFCYNTCATFRRKMWEHSYHSKYYSSGMKFELEVAF